MQNSHKTGFEVQADGVWLHPQVRAGTVADENPIKGQLWQSSSLSEAWERT